MELHFSVTGSPYNWGNTPDSEILSETGQKAMESMGMFLYTVFLK